MAVHFVGVKGDSFRHAVRIWGQPDFIHPHHDVRMWGEVDPSVDVIIFGQSQDPDRIHRR